MHAPRFTSSRTKLGEQLLANITSIKIDAYRSGSRIIADIAITTTVGMEPDDDPQAAMRMATDLIGALEDAAAVERSSCCDDDDDDDDEPSGGKRVSDPPKTL